MIQTEYLYRKIINVLPIKKILLYKASLIYIIKCNPNSSIEHGCITQDNHQILLYL